jgi:hypothetical protein
LQLIPAVSQQNDPVQQTEWQLANSGCHGMPQPERNISSSPAQGSVVVHELPLKEQLPEEQLGLKSTWQLGTG